MGFVGNSVCVHVVSVWGVWECRWVGMGSLWRGCGDLWVCMGFVGVLGGA